MSRIAGPPNKGMKLTKLSAAATLAPQAALSRRCRLMPALARTDAGTASQLIPGVRLLLVGRQNEAAAAPGVDTARVLRADGQAAPNHSWSELSNPGYSPS